MSWDVPADRVTKRYIYRAQEHDKMHALYGAQLTSRCMKLIDIRCFPWLMFAPYAMLTPILHLFLRKVVLGVYPA
jgi:hypothetical protein